MRGRTACRQWPFICATLREASIVCCTYAEGRTLSAEQLAALQTELDPGARRDDLFRELDLAIRNGTARVRAIAVGELEKARSVGKRGLPTTVAGLLVHVADHTQRHVGQAITTAKIVAAQAAG